MEQRSKMSKVVQRKSESLMNEWVTIKNPRIVLPALKKPLMLSLKVGLARTIERFDRFEFNELFHRWERKDEIRFKWTDSRVIEFEVYRDSNVPPRPQVLGEASISVGTVLRSMVGEVKIPLNYDHSDVGWMYCSISLSKTLQSISAQYLSIYRITLTFLETSTNTVKYEMAINNEVLIRDLQASQLLQNRINDPFVFNIKLSDYLVFSFSNDKHKPKRVTFLIDDLKRGEQSTIQQSILNYNNTKIGSIHIAYFIDNQFLSNKHIISQKELQDSIHQSKQQKFKRIIIEADSKVEKINNKLQELKNQIIVNKSYLERKAMNKVKKRYTKQKKLLKQNLIELQITQKTVQQKMKFYFQ